jgi:hypothetical protein
VSSSPSEFPSNNRPVLEWALSYARAGCKVLPLHRGLPELRKVPIAKLAPSGVYDATDDLTDIACSWNAFPDANIGIRTGEEGGYVVIDIDGEDGRATVAAWQAEGKNLFEVPTRISTSARQDLLSLAVWFKYPKGVEYIAGVVRVRPGIDVRGDGNYQVVPPSLHKTGSEYVWLQEVPWEQVAEVPNWLLHLLKAATEGREKPHRPKILAVEQPTPDEARELLEEDDVGAAAPQGDPNNPDVEASELQSRPGKKKTSWYQAAKKRLKGRDCYATIFEMGDFGPEGGRWKTVQSYISSASSLLSTLPGTSPQLVYALFIDALEQLQYNDAEAKSDWFSIAWSAVLYFYSADISKKELETAKQIEEKTESLSFIDKVLEGAKQWSTDDALWGRNCSSPTDWLMRRLIVYIKDHYYVLQENGYYNKYPVRKEQLVSKFKQTGIGGKGRILELETLVEDEKTKKRKAVTKTPTQLIDAHSFHVSKVRGVVGQPQKRDAWIDVSEDNALVVPLFHRRDDLEPVFDALCDEWLHVLFGKDYELGIEWIANALAFEEGPICALSLKGPGNAGKKLLVKGLQECINTGTFAKGEELVGKFQEVFMTTGFLVVNEGFPVSSRIRSIPDAFRSYTSGDPISVEPKFMPKIEISNPLRVILLANNYEMLAKLTGDKDLTKDDLEAIAQRILHIDIPDSAPNWLKAHGDYKLTKGWVASDSGGGSKYTLAKHFLWLHANRKPKTSFGRFLVEGNLSKDFALTTEHFVTKTTTAQKVIQTICRILDNQASGNGDGVMFDKQAGEIWATTSCIVDAWNKEISRGSGESITEKAAGAVLKTLCDKEVVTEKNMKKARWKRIKWEVVLQEAIEQGWPCKNLMALKAGQSKEQAI